MRIHKRTAACRCDCASTPAEITQAELDRLVLSPSSQGSTVTISSLPMATYYIQGLINLNGFISVSLKKTVKCRIVLFGSEVRCLSSGSLVSLVTRATSISPSKTFRMSKFHLKHLSMVQKCQNPSGCFSRGCRVYMFKTIYVSICQNWWAKYGLNSLFKVCPSVNCYFKQNFLLFPGFDSNNKMLLKSPE